MRIDLHNHTTLCNHATGTMEEYIKKAIELKIDTFGFSEHAPMNNFEDGYRLTLDKKAYYEKSVKELQEKYQDKINILLGYEVDYIDDSYLLDEIVLANVDYLIGSVHYLNDWGFDNPEFISEYKKRDINDVWRDYFQAVNNMAKSGKFDIVGHLDLIKVFNFLPTVDIKPIVLETLQSIKKNNMVLEINSAGFRKPVEEQYPSVDILQLASELNIPITFSSDAHSVDQVGLNYDRCIEIAKSIGYKECISFNKRDKIAVDF
jgi:histidinol-phosphatase (PHP family)